jgi:hypothetical protein
MRLANLKMLPRKLFLACSIVFCAAFFCGVTLVSAQEKVSGDLDVKLQIEQSLFDLESAYSAKDVTSLVALLDKNFEDTQAFKSSLENYFLSVKQAQIHFAVDSLVVEGDTIDVRLHWFKKTQGNTGYINKIRSYSSFVYRSSPQGLKLLYVRQENPFF